MELPSFVDMIRYIVLLLWVCNTAIKLLVSSARANSFHWRHHPFGLFSCGFLLFYFQTYPKKLTNVTLKTVKWRYLFVFLKLKFLHREVVFAIRGNFQSDVSSSAGLYQVVCTCLCNVKKFEIRCSKTRPPITMPVLCWISHSSQFFGYVIAGSFKSQLIDYFRGHIVSWEVFGRFMLIRTKWRFWTSWRHFGCTLWRSQLLCLTQLLFFYIVERYFLNSALIVIECALFPTQCFGYWE